MEFDTAEDLKKRKVKYKYEERVLLWEEPVQLRKYTPDFELPNGIIVECKGRWTVQDRKKMVHVIEQNPNHDIRILFERDRPINKGSKTRYSNWCDKRGIVYAIGRTIPEEWINETKKSKR